MSSDGKHLGPHRFKKGQSGNPKGKPKGATNHLTRDMKQMIEIAAKHAGDAYVAADKRKLKKNRQLEGLEGGAAYLAVQARENPVAFMGLLKSLLPAKIDIEATVVQRDIVDLVSKRRDKLSQMRDVTPQIEDDDG